MKKAPKKKTLSASQDSSEEDDVMPVPLVDTYDGDYDSIDEDIVEGDFVVVNVRGKS